MNIFLEHIVKKKRDRKDMLVIIALVAATLLVDAIILFILQYLYVTTPDTAQQISGICLLLIAGTWYGTVKLIARRNVEYEYTLTGNTLDIDAIYARKKRQNVLSVKIRDFDICAPCADEAYTSQYLDVHRIKFHYMLASTEMNYFSYFADFRYNGEWVRLIFEPTHSMLKAMKSINPNKVHIGEQDK